MQLLLISCLLTVTYGLYLIPNPKDGVIRYNSSDESTSLEFRQELEAFWTSYSENGAGKNSIIPCRDGEPPQEGSNKVCDVDLNDFGPCNPSTGFMYNSSESGPCVFIQFSKIPDWEPEYYNSSTFPENIPLQKELIDIFKNEKMVWLICLVESQRDMVNIGTIHYYPKSGFDVKYFPIRNEDDYIIPFIALHFEKPKRGVSVKIDCKAWAANLPNETVQFSILVD